MMGTFGGALEARQIDASNGRLTADATGEVENEEGVLVIHRIHVAMRLVAPGEVKETVERVHGIYAMRCPLYAPCTTPSSSPLLIRWWSRQLRPDATHCGETIRTSCVSANCSENSRRERLASRGGPP